MVISSILIGGFPLWAYNIFKTCVGSEEVSDLYGTLKRAHQTPDRYYHNWRHTLSVVRCAHRHAAFFEHQKEAVLAAFYHDCIYVPGFPDNEIRSAEFVFSELSGLLPENVVLQVQEYVLATSRHDLTPDPSLAVLLDCDMSILAAPWEIYTRYAIAIRKEFGRFSDDQYVGGRSRFLQETLTKREIFFLPPWKGRESIARENMERELKMLEKAGRLGKLW